MLLVTRFVVEPDSSAKTAFAGCCMHVVDQLLAKDHSVKLACFCEQVHFALVVPGARRS